MAEHDRRDENGRNFVAGIDGGARDQARRCRKKHRCLESGEPDCRVVDNVADKVFFVEGEKDRACPYRLTFGASHYCNCPLRQELHKKCKL